MKYKAKDLINTFNQYRAFKQKIIREWRLIRSIYKGDFWEVFKEQLDDFALTPDWNYFDYTIQAYNNSIYSGAFIGTVTPTEVKDTEYVKKLNSFIAYNWNKWGMKNKFLHVGEYGELYNLGVVRVDWNDKRHKIKLSAITPDEIFLDPNVDDYKDGHAIFIERNIDINKLKRDPRFEKKVTEYAKKKTRYDDKTRSYRIEPNNDSTSDSTIVSLLECFIRNDKGDIDQVFIIDEAEIIYEQESTIKSFPIAIYTPSRPEGNPYGNSRLVKILNTTITLNLLDSIESTHPYKIEHRPKLVNVDGKINLRSFSEYGNTPDALFEVHGDPHNVVQYIDIPNLPDMTGLKARLENSIFQVTGVDPYYKGRMTNSIQTTGATQAFQARVTMLTDNSKITMLEEFCEDLTMLIIEFYTNFSDASIYKVPKLDISKKKVESVTDFMFNKETKLNYMINASVLLPMNQANLFESAKALYQMQGQYKFKEQVITPEDLIMYSDFPQKDLLLQRLKQSKSQTASEDIVSTLYNFADIFSKLVSQNVPEEQAAQEAIKILMQEKNAMIEDPTLGVGLQ